MSWQHERRGVGWESTIKTKAPWLPKCSKLNLGVWICYCLSVGLLQNHTQTWTKSHGAAEVTQGLASNETWKCHNFPHTSEVSGHLTKPSKPTSEPSNTPPMLKSYVFNSTMPEAQYYFQTSSKHLQDV